MIKKGQFLESFLILLILSSIFSPTIQLGVDIRIDDMLSFLLIPIFILVKPNFRVNRLVKSYFLVLLLMLFSTFYGYVCKGVPFSFRDFNELFRMFKPLLILILVDYCDLKLLSNKLFVLIKFGAIFLVLIGFFEYFNIFGFRKLLSFLYSSDRFDDLSRARVVLTAGDPNIAAALLLYFVIYCLQLALLNIDRFRCVVMLVLLLVVLFMTSSRTSIVIFVAILLTSMYYHRQNNKLFNISVLTILVLVFIFTINYFQYLVLGFTTFSEGSNTSMLLRYQQWSIAYNLFLSSPIFGWGPAKAIHSTIVDSEHLLLLRRYGVLGYLFVLNFLFGYVLVFFRNRKKIHKLNPQFKTIIISTLFYCFMIFILMTTNNFLSGYQLMPLFIVMLVISEAKLKDV